MADYTPTSWAKALLAKLGMPVTTGNVAAITAWEAAEGGHWGNPDRFNPLNTTQGAPGAVSTNSAGVKAYTSWDQGLSSTVATLTNGMYSGILSALKSGNSASAVVSAVIGSPWGTKKISLDGATYNPTNALPASTGTQVGDMLGLDNVGSWLQSTAVRGVVILGGVALVVLGALRGTHVLQKAKGRADQVGQTVAMATPEGAAVMAAKGAA